MTRPHMPPLLTSSNTQLSHSSIEPSPFNDGLVSSTARTRSGTASDVTWAKTRADDRSEGRSIDVGAGREGAGGGAADTGRGASRGSGLKRGPAEAAAMGGTGLVGLTGATVGVDVVDGGCEALALAAGRVRMILAV